MLMIQRWLTDNEADYKKLEQEYGIFTKFHTTKPYILLDYDMVESSKVKTHILVKECRGLCLRTDDFSIIHKAFNRFFNVFEEELTTKNFNWKSFYTTEKIDGSLIKIRWYDDDFFVTTRNSFADSICGDSDKSWKELVVSCLSETQKTFIKDNDNITFVMEFGSPFNTVVVHHNEPVLYLLGMFDEDGDQVSLFETFKIFKCSRQYNFKSLDEILLFLNQIENDKNPMEGFVVTDNEGRMLKIKSKFYLTLHRLSGNGNISMVKNLVPIILQGETDEILSYFPYLAEKISEIETTLASLWDDLHALWNDCKHITDQKEFALFIVNKNEFTSILFNLKKNGKLQDHEALKHSWNQSASLILKVLKED